MLRILSLDDGGTRGLSSLLILREVMDAFQYKMGKSFEPCDFFDLIVGAGTGGLSTVFLGRMRLTLDQAIHEYTRMWQTLSQSTWVHQDLPDVHHRRHCVLDGTEMKEHMSQVVAHYLDDPETSMFDPTTTSEPSRCRAAVLVPTSTTTPHVFRTYQNSPSCTLVDVVRAIFPTASTTQPVWFNYPSNSGPSFDASAGGTRNPAEIALAEVHRIWPTQNVDFVLSIGAGIRITSPSSGSALPVTGQYLSDIAEVIHDRVYRRFTPMSYFRLNVDRGLEEIDGDDYNRSGVIGLVTDITNVYLRKVDTNERVALCVSVMTSTLATESAMLPQEQNCEENIAQSQQTQARQEGLIKYIRNCLPIVTDVSYDPSRVCFTGTRSAILDYILEWSSDNKMAPSIFWLHDEAGAGKSAIAHTIAERADQAGQLGGCLFMHREIPDRRNIRLLINTLALHLAAHSSALAAGIHVALCSDPLLGHDEDVSRQFQKLICEPLTLATQSSQHPPILLVVDDIDSLAPTHRMMFLESLLAWNIPGTVRVFLTSRTEQDMEEVLSSTTVLSASLKQHSMQTDSDIELVTRHWMVRVRARYSTLNQTWPGEEAICSLVRKASGFFTWINTACSFIYQKDPERRLNIVLTGDKIDAVTDPHAIEKSWRSILDWDYEAAFDKGSPYCLDGQITRLSQFPVASGGYADVWEGFLGNQKVAVKVIRHYSENGLLQDKTLFKRLWREYLSWSWHSHSNSHKNVLQCIGFSNEFSQRPNVSPSFISPWMSNGTAAEYIKQNPSSDHISLLVGVIDGLSFLHSQNPPIIHGDIRARNILISDTGIPHLSDFGLSRVLGVQGMSTSSEVAGSLRWMAPELFHSNGGITLQSDIWAFGMTILEILSGQCPYQEVKRDVLVLGKIMAGQIPIRPQGDVSSLLNDDMWILCLHCWRMEPMQRPLSEDVLKMLQGDMTWCQITI